MSEYGIEGPVRRQEFSEIRRLGWYASMSEVERRQSNSFVARGYNE